MNKITITDPVRLREAIGFARNAGCLDQFGRDLCHLIETLSVGMSDSSSRYAELSRDFAPHSFSFAIWQGEPISRETLLLNGGFIHHDDNRWMIHT